MWLLLIPVWKEVIKNVLCIVWRDRKNQQDAKIRCLLLTSVSTCFGHHYAHLHENKDRVTAFGVLFWFCWMWLVAVVGRCVLLLPILLPILLLFLLRLLLRCLFFLILLLLPFLLLLLLLPLILLLFLWHYSPMPTFAYSTHFSQSALFFDFSFQFAILHFLISM